MAAFNWIEFTARCPVCLNQTTIRAQTHLASSFRSDAAGRLCQRTYSLGDTMAWSEPAMQGSDLWMEGGEPVEGVPGAARECCYASCVAKNDPLYVVVEVVERVIRRVLDIGPESEWPATYPR